MLGKRVGELVNEVAGFHPVELEVSELVDELIFRIEGPHRDISSCVYDLVCGADKSVNYDRRAMERDKKKICGKTCVRSASR